MRNRNSLIQQMQRQRDVNFANQNRVANRSPRRAVSVTPQLRGQFSSSVQDVQELTAVARRVMLAHNAMLTGQLNEDLVNRAITGQFPYSYSEIDDNLSHLYNTNNHQELVAAFQMNARRSNDIRNTINNLMNDMQTFVQARGQG